MQFDAPETIRLWMRVAGDAKIAWITARMCSTIAAATSANAAAATVAASTAAAAAASAADRVAAVF